MGCHRDSGVDVGDRSGPHLDVDAAKVFAERAGTLEVHAGTRPVAEIDAMREVRFTTDAVDAVVAIRVDRHVLDEGCSGSW